MAVVGWGLGSSRSLPHSYVWCLDREDPSRGDSSGTSGSALWSLHVVPPARSSRVARLLTGISAVTYHSSRLSHTTHPGSHKSPSVSKEKGHRLLDG